ncbi:hypothetical protein IE81DRAFT_368197 [Ceraceosorus guamensis]|uniref:intramembrane prenyl-peptidase Rce1 n=1 Tax=Ceraceosorus guamensis TaxID=1522189 RepID=A0A316VT29_9BASI|nr:hypothetical protein IE81DRAFT_368197 [Ceraceosorus guamensis]PWN40530.1 hypothetical protein IE81DRAFT_368197 [Ceraceosorus guamensis]
MISPFLSLSTSSILTLSYVGGLYVSSKTRVGTLDESTGLKRTKDDADVVRARLKTIGYVAAGSVVLTLAVLSGADEGTERGKHPLIRCITLLSKIGLPLPYPSILTNAFPPLDPPLFSFLLTQAKHVLYGLGLTATLYFGPLVTLALDKELPGQENFEYKRDVQSRWDNVWGLRNYVVGPLTEEIVFRGCIVGLTSSTRSSTLFHSIFLTPFYFAVAHLHHAYEVWADHQYSTTGLKIGLTHATFQLLYTSLFGWYANWLFVKSASLAPSLVAHVWCNIMGLPAPFDDASRLAVPDAKEQRRFEKDLLNVSNERERAHVLDASKAIQSKLKRRKWIVWTSHVMGVAGFAWAIRMS